MTDAKNASRRIEDLNTLLDVSRQLGATTELTPLLERIVSAATEVLDCERASVFLYNSDSHELHSKAATGTGELRFSANQGIAGECVRTRQIINVPDAYGDRRFNPEVDKATGYRTRNLLTFPLRGHQGELVGVLQVLNKRSGPFGAREEDLASTLSLQAGVAIQRQMLLDDYAEKQKLERDLSLARDIQQSLLPKHPPTIDGYDIAGFNQPADATGGDCYDYFEAAAGRTAFLIADATGHGIGPALLVSQFRAMVRAIASRETNIANTMCRVNALLTGNIPNGMFVTSFLGTLDATAGTINYVSAGQGPLLVYRRETNEAIQLEATTVPLGILEDFPCDVPAPIKLNRGDMLMLVTDGFLEWFNEENAPYGVERLFDVVRNNPQASASSTISLIRESIATFSEGTEQLDDLTAIIIQRL